MVAPILRIAWNRVTRNKRLVVTLWTLNLVATLTVAIPFHRQLERILAPTADDERLVERLDETWLRMYSYEFRHDPSTRLLDHSILGAAPFVHHLDQRLSGSVTNAVGMYLLDTLVHLRVRPPYFRAVVVLSLIASVGGMFFSGGFLSVYASSARVTVADWVAHGARMFGKMFRIGLIGATLGWIIFVGGAPWVSRMIESASESSSSEWPAYIQLLLLNGVVLAGIWLAGIVHDYARVRMVLEERTSAILAVVAGMRYVIQNRKPIFVLAGGFALAGIVTIVCTGTLLEYLQNSTGWMIVAMVLVQQLFMFIFFGLRALQYAAVVEVFRTHPPRDEYPLREFGT